MPAWLTANLPTLLVCVLLAAVVALVIWSLLRRKKKGQSACGCGCGGCAMSGVCHSKR